MSDSEHSEPEPERDDSGKRRRKVRHVVQVQQYDFTYFGPKDGDLPAIELFVELWRPLFKKWTFQLEKTPTTNKLHYQGRGSLHKKKRHGELCTLLNETDLRGMDVSESSNNSNSLEVFYALKYDTRIEGPWTDRTWVEPEYVPRQYRGYMEKLFPYQKQIFDSRLTFSDREVNLVCDKRGNNGKSTVAA